MNHGEPDHHHDAEEKLRREVALFRLKALYWDRTGFCVLFCRVGSRSRLHAGRSQPRAFG